MRFLTILSAVCLLLLTGIAMAIEEPEFNIIEQHEDYDIRQYEPYLVAEVAVNEPFKKAGNTAFGILADYIFGANTSATKMAMTAPVESQDMDSGTRMKMTAPVLSSQEAQEEESYRYAFVIERRYDLDSVPKPIDERINLRMTQARTVAVRRYSGSWSQSNYEKYRAELMSALQRDGIETIGQSYLARYDAPFVPWFLRRNEVIVEVVPESATGISSE